jgi:hypothetical protein
VALQSNSLARERILVMGYWKVGKSKTWLDIVRWIIKTKSDAKVYVLDTDYAVDRMSEQIEGFEKVVEWIDVNDDWRTLVNGTQDFAKKVQPQDWMVVDMANGPWDYVQAYYTEQVFEKPIDQFFLDQKKAGGKGLAGAYGENWGIINKLYRGWIMPYLQAPCHKLVCVPADRIDRDNDGKELQDLFGRYGVKPVGQKALGHQFHSVLLLSKGGPGKYTISTVGDRGRDELKDEPISDFVMQYLVKIAGWTV